MSILPSSRILPGKFSPRPATNEVKIRNHSRVGRHGSGHGDLVSRLSLLLDSRLESPNQLYGGWVVRPRLDKSGQRRGVPPDRSEDEQVPGRAVRGQLE